MKTGYKYFNKVNAAVFCIVLTGCATTQPSDSVDKAAESKRMQNTAASIDAPLVSANDSLLAMLRYYKFVNGLSKSQLSNEYKRINDAYFARPNDRSGLKRGMLLMIADSEFYDLNQAKQLFSDILNSKDNSVPAFKEFASFMLSILGSRDQAKQQYTQLQEQLKHEKIKRQQIEEKLEALKSIEENMTQRRSQ